MKQTYSFLNKQTFILFLALFGIFFILIILLSLWIFFSQSKDKEKVLKKQLNSSITQSTIQSPIITYSMNNRKLKKTLDAALKEPEKTYLLDLSHQGLVKLPEKVGQLTNLSELYLNNNKLTQLPPEIYHLKNLTILDLSGNPISTDEVQKVRKLLPNTQVFFILPMNPP